VRRYLLVIAGLLCWLVYNAPLNATSSTPDTGPETGPDTGRWQESSFIGPEDSFQWHAVFYLTAIERPQLITRHTGLMIRCTDAEINNNIQIAFAFGSVLRTNSRNEVLVDIALDGRSRNNLKLVTRNHANAEFIEFGAKSFLQQLMSSNTLQFGARLSPKGSAKVAMPLAPGRKRVTAMLEKCGINLNAEVIAEQNRRSSRQVASKAKNRANKAPETTPLARAVSAFLAANNQTEIDDASRAIVRLDNPVDTVIKALGAEDALMAEARSGLPGPGDEGVSLNVIDGVTIPFHVSVPTPSYIKKTAEAGMPLVIVLHGGVRRPPWRDRERWWQSYPFDDLLREFLVVSPAGWRDAFWWGDTQNRNLRQLIAQTQRHYRIDASRVFILGVSDGAAGALHLAMTDATPLAGVVSLIGHPQALFDESINSGTKPQLANLSQVPIFMVNGSADNSMPIDTLEPWLESMQALDVQLDSTIEPGMGHELFFSKSTNEKLEEFLNTTRKADTAGNLAWEAGTAQLPSRHRWLVIDKLKPGAELGCVRAQRTANGQYEIATEGIANLRILAPHGQKEMQISVNPEARRRAGAQTVRLEPNPNVASLLKWHARDANHKQHYSSEHIIEIESNTRGVCQSPRGHTLIAQATKRKDADRRRQQAAELRARTLNRRRATGNSQPGNIGGLLQDDNQRGQPGSGRAVGDPTRIKDPRNRQNRSPNPTDG